MEAKELRDMSVDDLAGEARLFARRDRSFETQTGHESVGKPDETPGNQARLGSGGNDFAGTSAPEWERFSMSTRGLRKERSGLVISDRMQKTVVVSVERTVMHPRYRKYLKRRTKVKAHDENNQCHVGDRVVIVESRPLSRDKRWRVSKILERAQVVGGRIQGSERVDVFES